MYLLLKQISTIIIQKYESCTQQKNSNYNAESVSERYDIKYFKYAPSYFANLISHSCSKLFVLFAYTYIIWVNVDFN